jgi:pimeloyl-ACP methyl ester carboxylesterase
MVTVGFDSDGGEMTTPGAPTLLLIHGFLDDASVWDGLVESLGGEVGAVRYDLPGFGNRTGSIAEALGTTLDSLADEASDVVGGIDGPVIVAGQSLGTQVAELVASRHSDKVHGLVLITPVPLGGTRLPDEVVAPFGALGGDRVAGRRVRAQLSPHMSEEQLDRLADIGVPVSADVTAHYADMWNTGVRNAPTTSAFDGPVLVIRGGADGFVNQQLVDAITPRFHQVEVKVLERGGHWVHVECPGAVATMILDFADSVTFPPVASLAPVTFPPVASLAPVSQVTT